MVAASYLAATHRTTGINVKGRGQPTLNRAACLTISANSLLAQIVQYNRIQILKDLR